MMANARDTTTAIDAARNIEAPIIRRTCDKAALTKRVPKPSSTKRNATQYETIIVLNVISIIYLP